MLKPLSALAALALCASVAFAQSPATNEKDAEYARQQQQRQVTQPLNNQPLWSEVRSGIPQRTTVVGRETDVLMQPEGQTWRAFRNGQAAVYGGWALVVMLLALGGFYAWKGKIELHKPPTGRLIRRFTSWQRAIHWTTAIAFVVLAISGLIILFGKNILLPLIGYTLFSWLAILAKNLHNFVGPVFIVCLVLMFFSYVKYNFPKAYDLKWLARFGGLVSGEHVPSGKFNAGEKMWFWGGVLLLGAIVSVSGLVLNFPNFNQTRQTMQFANIVHLIGSTLFILGGLAHIYLGTIGMRGAYDSMRTGYVDETWAKEHHEYWYQDVKAGRAEAQGETPATLARRTA